MKCRILHESRGSLRVHMEAPRMTLEQADRLEYYLRAQAGVRDVKVYDRTGDAIVRYRETEAGSVRGAVLLALARFSYEDERVKELVPDHTGRLLNRQYEDRLVFTVLRRGFMKLFFPMGLQNAVTVAKSVRYIWKGLRCLQKSGLEVPVLDATAILVSVLRRSYGTASSVMFLLDIGDILEEWTHKKSVDDLARTMSLNVDKVWMRRSGDGQEVLVPVHEVGVGDDIVIRTGNMIPLDGKVVSGEATVNQASITGESLPVRKESGSVVYAGTVVEEGECVIRVDKAMGGGRYDRIVRMIEESEKLKSQTEDRASHLADRLVPYTLGGTVLVYLLTRNVTKALSVLMVDFSCALKLSMPIAVLSAMRESSYHHVSVKGGRFLEAVAQADTIVFDKTGTLTHATPRVAQVVTFGGHDEREMLRSAACLEEHYPHSIANAVVAEAKRRDLRHEEHHSKVEYVVAHGISSIMEGQKVVIGSYHFVFQDEGCVVPEGEQEKFAALPDEYSHLYLAMAGELAAVICIEDPLRDEAKDVVRELHELGLSKIVMMTGDSERTARAVAAAVGVDEYHAEVLPEDKAAFVKKEHEAGRRVIMIGDGVNDSPALSEADAGIAISDGAAIAREIADITVSADDLRALVTLRRLSGALMSRIDRNYRFIMSFNLLLILLGVGGVAAPTTTALLHNLSTIGIALDSMTNLLEEEE
ncbi:MAG: heavy metal translocating P-type ATPase [Eubacteriales bacterium]|nr:heavy metal translocating P-type ATPase [Eubacteriales bacterium]